MLCWPAERNISTNHFAFSPVNKQHDEAAYWSNHSCSCILYHQAVTARLQRAEADAEQDRRGEGVVVDEAATLGVAVVTVQGQIYVGVAGIQYGTEVDLYGDGLNPTVHADVSLTWRRREEPRTVGLAVETRSTAGF